MCTGFAKNNNDISLKISMTKKTYKLNEPILARWELKNNSNKTYIVSVNTTIDYAEPYVPIFPNDHIPEYDIADNLLSSLSLGIEKFHKKEKKYKFIFPEKIKKFLPEPMEIPIYRTYPFYLYPEMSISQTVCLTKLNDGFQKGFYINKPGKYRICIIYKMLDYWVDQFIDYVQYRQKNHWGAPEITCIKQNGAISPIEIYEGTIMSNRVEFEVVK